LNSILRLCSSAHLPEGKILSYSVNETSLFASRILAPGCSFSVRSMMLMLFNTPAMVSFTRANGSLMVQLGVRSQDFAPFVQEVMKKGPSIE
jgi:hypothetical protein